MIGYRENCGQLVPKLFYCGLNIWYYMEKKIHTWQFPGFFSGNNLNFLKSFPYSYFTRFLFGHRHVQILHSPLHWIHAELAQQPAGERKRRGEGNLKPDLPGDGVPPPASRVPPASQRHQHQARWVRHALRDRRQVHFRRPTVSLHTSVTTPLPLSSHRLDLIARFRWERKGTCVFDAGNT